MAQTNQRFLDAQAELLASTVDQGELARLAQPVYVGRRRVPGLRLQDDRVIRLLDVLLHPGGFVADWTTRDVLARLQARHRLTDADYRLSQLRYDLGKRSGCGRSSGGSTSAAEPGRRMRRWTLEQKKATRKPTPVAVWRRAPGTRWMRPCRRRRRRS
jgi:hypothetical protein